MNYYIGIDLGTTNSAICSYDGDITRIWKSPEQNDVTPSAIYIDKRGTKYYGKGAYDKAPLYPNNSATLFKRFMGTNTLIDFPDLQISLRPEECSAEILKVLFGYLPEEIRTSDNVSTVITVPSAFNQMQKDATLQAATLAGIGNVALMQEPVAAIMSIMRSRKQSGLFLVYDLGGGTFDVSVAENIGGNVSLLTHGGIQMCGGRDFDKAIMNNIVIPWLIDNFSLSKRDILTLQKYKKLFKRALWTIERTKVELSSNDEARIYLSEDEANSLDANGNDIYIDISMNRSQFNEIISEMVSDTISTTKDILKKAGLSANDLDKAIFIGGPTNYKPLRDRVSFELSISASTEVNPMTAVAEGASIFAESIDWGSKNHNRKTDRSELLSNSEVNIKYDYKSRTAKSKAKIIAQLIGEECGIMLEMKSSDTGWSSGRVTVAPSATLDLPLDKVGDNEFIIIVYDKNGYPLPKSENRISINKTTATIDSIPASHSIGIELCEKLGGTTFSSYIVKEGDPLPQKGRITLKAAEKLKAGSSDSLNIKLWEGSISTPITDNRFIGALKINGIDFDNGVINIGDILECEYEIIDSGNIHLSVSVPSIGAVFSKNNLYSRQEGQIDLKDTEKIANEAKKTLDRINEMAEKVNDPKLEKAKSLAHSASKVDDDICDMEDAQKASEDILKSKKLISESRAEHLKEIRQIDLDKQTNLFESFVKEGLLPEQEIIFTNRIRSLQSLIDRNDMDFENQLKEFVSQILNALWQQDWYVIHSYNYIIRSNNSDDIEFQSLKVKGLKCLEKDSIDELREIVIQLLKRNPDTSSSGDMYDIANVLRG